MKNPITLNSAPSAESGIFGLGSSQAASEIVLLGVPWDVTTSYGDGCYASPKLIEKASHQLDFFSNHFDTGFLERGVYLEHLDDSYTALRHKTIEAARTSRQGCEASLNLVNQQCQAVQEKIRSSTESLLKDGKKVGLIGGDHSCPLEYVKTLAESARGTFDVLHIDAHLDLRKSYEGFTHSHASIFYNLRRQVPNIGKVIHLGIRDFCQEEFDFATQHEHQMHEPLNFDDLEFKEVAKQIVKDLGQNFYISFDVDGLDPAYCPNTGTPVPGGLSFLQVQTLLKRLSSEKKNLIGFDLCETGPEEYDCNVASRILLMLCSLL